jgi:uncharacterized delta-60 repeat protein
MRYVLVLALAVAAAGGAVVAAPIDGTLDPGFGDGGRGVFGFMQSSTPQLRAIAKYPASGRIWMFADDVNDPAAIYLTRSFANGSPDTGFGPLSDGQRRIALPAALLPQSEALTLDGALIQADGKPLIFGGLRPLDGEAGAFPAILCRLTAAGTLDSGFDGDGCATFRSFLNSGEICRATDAAISSSDQSITVVGNCFAETLSERPFITRILSSGAMDLDFAAGAGFSTPPLPLGVLSQHYESVVLRPNGFASVLGTFEAVSNNISDLDLGVIQFDGGGSPDTGFGNNALRILGFDVGGNNHDRARDLVLRADGRLVALGEARNTDSGRTVALLAQLSESGNLDPAFSSDGKQVDQFNGVLGTNSALAAMTLDESGQLLVSAQQMIGQTQAGVDVGSDFWFALPPTVPPAQVTRVMISAEVATAGTISSPSFPQTFPFNALPGVPAIVDLPHDLHDTGNFPNGIISNRSVHVVASGPVGVTAIHGRFGSLESALITPSNALGKDYRVMAWGAGIGAGSQIVVVATANQTQVRITPRVLAAGHAADVPFQITLAQGEAYHLSADAVDADLTGSRVVADKPVAVFSGHTCAKVPIASIDFCDLVYEQQRPVTQWGDSFVMVPHPVRPNGDVIRILAHEPDTAVYENGQRLATLMPGESHIVLRSHATLLTTSKPASVAQFARGCRADVAPECWGDPYQLTLTPMSGWSTRMLLGVHDEGGNGAPAPLMSIVAEQAGAASIRVNGAPIPAAAFAPAGANSLVYAQLVRTPGSSDLITADTPISVTVVGMLASEAHAHNAAVVHTGVAGDPVASADDVLLRLNADGSRDTGFGNNGFVRIDHTGYFQSVDKSLDRPLRVIPDGNGIIVGSAVRNADSSQDLLLNYRLISDAVFANGFE